MNYNSTLKCYFENLTAGQGHDLIRKGHVAYQSIRMIILNTSIVFFIVLVGPYKTLLPKTAGELS